MELNDIRIAVTLMGLLGFLGIVRWAWSRGRAAEFERVAQSVLDSDTPAPLRGTKEPQ